MTEKEDGAVMRERGEAHKISRRECRFADTSFDVSVSTDVNAEWR